MTTLLAAIASFAVGWLLGRWRLGVEDNRGEAAVRRILAAKFPSQDYHLLNNVTLPADDGTTQVDHILVCRYGVFVIETKHYSGWIFCDADARQWTQVIFRSRHKFQNPIHQNRKHVKTISALLDFIPTENIHSVVVFTGDAVFKTGRPAGVLLLNELQTHIAGFRTEVMSDNRVQFCVGRLECQRRALTRQTDIEHAAYLRRKFGDPGK